MAIYGNSGGYNNYNYSNANPYINQGFQNQYQGSGWQQQPMPAPMQSGANMYSVDNSSTSQAGRPIWVKGENEARMYPAREPVWLMDSGSMVCYFKSPDMPEMKIYDMVERTPNGIVQTQYPQISMENEAPQRFATLEALQNLERKVDEIMNSKNMPQNSQPGRGGRNNV